MYGQSPIPSRETSNAIHQRTQTPQQQRFRQLINQMLLYPGQNASLLPQISGVPTSNSTRGIIESMLTEGVRELLVLPPSSLSSIGQPQLQTNSQEAQRYSDGNQYVIQLPVQANQQSSRIFEQSHAEQFLLQIPVQPIYVTDPENTNTQIFLQPQLLTTSSISPLESSIASQQSNMQRAESLFLQPSQQSAQNIQQQNLRGNHLLTDSQPTNQSLQLHEPLNGYHSQHVQGIQHSLLRLSQPVLSLQPLLQQTQPLLVQVLQPSITSQQEHSQQNQNSLLRVSQQSVLQRMPTQSSLQQVQSTQQAHIQRPLAQQSNQSTTSLLSRISREMAQVVQQVQSNQPSQSIQEISRQMYQQSTMESRKTSSESLENTLSLSRVRQMIRQELDQQQMGPQPQPRTLEMLLSEQLDNTEEAPLRILRIAGPHLQPSDQSSETAHDSLEIPDISLFSLSPQYFMRIIQQRHRPRNQSSLMQSFRQSRLRSFSQPHRILTTPTQLVQESFRQSNQQSTSLHHESATRLPQSFPPENDIQILPTDAAAPSNRSRSSEVMVDGRVTIDTNESRERVPEGLIIDFYLNKLKLSELGIAELGKVFQNKNCIFHV